MPPAELAEYFGAERQGGFVLVAVAVSGFGFAAFLWFGRSAFVAMAWPLVVLAVLQLIIGLTVALRTPAQIATLDQGLHTSPASTISAETTRMSAVNRNFRIVKVVEVVVMGLGVLLAIGLPHPGAWAAVGLGLLLEGAVLLVFDAFAHQRALVYTQWLAQLPT